MNWNRFTKWRESKNLISFVVAFAIFIDNLILTVIVPILPVFLYNKQYPDDHTSESLSHSSHLNSGSRNSSHEQLMAQSSDDGFLLASKPLVQLLVNPFVGSLITKVGYVKSMLLGFVVLLASTLLFAFGESYSLLFIARAVQGIGSSFSSVAGLAFLADIYRDDSERAKAMTIAFSGLTFGQIVGLPFGGIMYELFDKTIPYLIICLLTLIDGFLLLLIIQPKNGKTVMQSTSLVTLVKDPYILLIAGLRCNRFVRTFRTFGHRKSLPRTRPFYRAHPLRTFLRTFGLVHARDATLLSEDFDDLSTAYLRTRLAFALDICPMAFAYFLSMRRV